MNSLPLFRRIIDSRRATDNTHSVTHSSRHSPWAPQQGGPHPLTTDSKENRPSPKSLRQASTASPS